jgi:hypothetical protein
MLEIVKAFSSKVSDSEGATDCRYGISDLTD